MHALQLQMQNFNHFPVLTILIFPKIRHWFLKLYDTVEYLQPNASQGWHQFHTQASAYFLYLFPLTVAFRPTQ